MNARVATKAKPQPTQPVETEKPSNGAGAKVGKGTVIISRPNLVVAEFEVFGTAPYVQNAFPQKAIDQIHATQAAGSQAKSKRVRAAKNFDEVFEGAKHVSTDGWLGQPCAAYRNAMISACRLVGFMMTKAKLSFFVLPDGYDRVGGDGLVRIYGEPERVEHYARNDNGSVDLRIRPMWREWTAKPKVRFDLDQFSEADMFNLLLRAGMQVGLGEGRPDSKNSGGLGWGTFEIKADEVSAAAE
jgi:hypothetical protein